MRKRGKKERKESTGIPEGFRIEPELNEEDLPDPVSHGRGLEYPCLPMDRLFLAVAHLPDGMILEVYFDKPR